MTDRPAGLILDFGGVLTLDFWGALASWCEREGLPRNALINAITGDTPARQLLADLECGAITQDVFANHMAEVLGVPAAGLLERMAAELKPDAAMIRAAADLRAAGIPVGILSNSWGSKPLDPYAAWALDEYYDAVVISDRVGLRKPDRRIYEIAVTALGVPADRCVFVDDVATYLEPARELGMTVIHHVDTDATVRELGRLFGVTLRPVARAG
jgi:putative hydrolase of the HAD superfamily